MTLLFSMTMKLFIVEDSAIISYRMISMISKINGTEILGVSDNAESAIAKIRETRPEIVILDIRLKNGNGMDVLQHIKKDMPETKVVMFSNFPYPQYINRCKELGADYFFDKSKDFDNLVKLISGNWTDANSHRMNC